MAVALVSPHADDIALCLGGWVAAVAPRVELSLVTVFSRSDYAPHAAVRGAEAVSRARAGEDTAYARQHGLAHRLLGFADSSCIGLDDDSELTAPDDSDPRRAAVEAAVADAVQGATVLAAPIGVGGHVDHRLVRNAVARAAGPRLCLWYEDLPYALEVPPGWEPDLVSPLTGGPLAAWLFAHDDHLAAKRRGLAHYRSQLAPREVEAVLAYRPTAGCSAERVWVDARSVTGPGAADHVARLAHLGFRPAAAARSVTP